jgi:hypothetical protein
LISKTHAFFKDRNKSPALDTLCTQPIDSSINPSESPIFSRIGGKEAYNEFASQASPQDTVSQALSPMPNYIPQASPYPFIDPNRSQPLERFLELSRQQEALLSPSNTRDLLFFEDNTHNLDQEPKELQDLIVNSAQVRKKIKTDSKPFHEESKLGLNNGQIQNNQGYNYSIFVSF